jgi:hypothetical protein
VNKKKTIVYPKKIFVGGLPNDVTESKNIFNSLLVKNKMIFIILCFIYKKN